MEYKDYYATLGVPRTASQADIKKAFRKLARQHHPDVNKGDGGAERRFKDVNEAYAVLGEAEKRKAYDALGADWEAYQRAGAGAAGADPFAGFAGFRGGAPGGIRFEYHGDPEDLAGFSDFFRTFFAGGGPGRAGAGPSPGARPAGGTRSAGQRIRTDAGTLDDILAGFGTGDLDDASLRRGRGGRGAAPRADVEAEVEVSLEDAFHGTQALVAVGGRRLEVRIPPGVASGQRIRLTGQAGTGRDAGDIFLMVTVRPHPVFTRSGADLHRELPVTLGEALLGGEVPVQTLSGRVLLRIPPETQSGRTFRLAGKGMPRFRGDGHGDMYVKVRVVLPTDLDEEGRRLSRAFVDHVRQPDPRSARGEPAFSHAAG
jgi:curved DNA-binding protein